MKAVIHQTLCHIFDLNACAFPLAKINNAFMRDEAVFTFEKNWKVWIESLRDLKTFYQQFGPRLPAPIREALSQTARRLRA